MIGYYYCSVQTFLNIIKNKQIYLSDPLKMNDSLEIKWYLKKLIEDNSYVNEINMNQLEVMESRSGIDFTVDKLINNLENNGQSSSYICCFSKEPDLLSQWRAYANNATGLSIGFDLDKLARADNILVKEVIYTNSVETFNELEESDVEVISDTIQTVISYNGITSKEETISIFIHELIPTLLKYKNPAFKEEKEVRLIYCDDMKFEKIVDEHNAFLEKCENIKLDHDFRTTNSDSNITEYVKLDFDSSDIKDIVLGPNCKLKVHDIKKICSHYLDQNIPNVNKSTASYR